MRSMAKRASEDRSDARPGMLGHDLMVKKRCRRRNRVETDEEEKHGPGARRAGFLP